MMSDQALSIFQTFADSAVFQSALAELVAEQIKAQTELMRGYVHAGMIGSAQMAEGALRAYEDLPNIIASYAKKYRPERV